MWDFIFSSLWGWLGVAGVTVIVCGAVAFIFPSLRLAMLAVAGAAVTLAGAYAKGNRDRAKLEQKRKEEAVQKARKAYDEINKRPDTPDTVAKRLNDGTY